MAVLDIIRKLIEDNPAYCEEIYTLKSNLYFEFKHSPIISPSMTIDSVPITPTYDLEAGFATFATAQTGTLVVRYKYVWFSDTTITQMLSYREVSQKLLLIATGKFAFLIPQYPIKFVTKDIDGNVISSTFSETTMDFTATATSLTIEGIVADMYNTVGTLLLLKASNPQKIRKEFLSFNDWGSYPNIAQGLREQADYWFKFSGR